MEFSNDQIDFLTETMSIGLGHAGHILSDFLSKKVALSTPVLEINNLESLINRLNGLSKELICIQMNFRQNIKGSCSLAILPDSAKNLISLLTQKSENEDMEVFKYEVINEIGNIIISSVAGTTAKMLSLQTYLSYPEFRAENTIEYLNYFIKNENLNIFNAQTTLTISDLDIKTNILMSFNEDTLKEIRTKINHQLVGSPL